MSTKKLNTLTLPIKRLETRSLAVSFVLLTTLGVIVFFQKYIKYAATNEYFSAPLALLYHLIIFSTFALFTPLIIKAVKQHPIGKGYSWQNFGKHLVFSIILGLTHMLLCNLILYGLDLASSPIFPRFITKYLTNVIHFHLLTYWIIAGFASIYRDEVTRHKNSTLKRFVIKENRYTTLLELEEVYWIEAIDHYQKLHTENGFFIYKDSISNLSKNLPHDKFRRVHRSSIVNVEKVDGLKKI